MNETLDWTERAACRAHPNADAWFPGPRESGNDAKAVCETCPVRLECLVASIVNSEDVGIWGGVGGKDRRPLSRAFAELEHDPLEIDEACGCWWCTAVAARFAGEVLNANGPGATHGLRVTFARGCRCAACTWAASADGQTLASTGVNTADWWLAHDGPGTEGDLFAALIGTDVVRDLHPKVSEMAETIVVVHDAPAPVNRFAPRLTRSSAA